MNLRISNTAENELQRVWLRFAAEGVLAAHKHECNGKVKTYLCCVGNAADEAKAPSRPVCDVKLLFFSRFSLVVVITVSY